MEHHQVRQSLKHFHHPKTTFPVVLVASHYCNTMNTKGKCLDFEIFLYAARDQGPLSWGPLSFVYKLGMGNAFNHNKSSNAHAKLWKVKMDHLIFSVTQSCKGFREICTHFLSPDKWNEGCICHMASDWANIWRFRLCPPSLFYILQSPAHTEALYPGSLQGQTGNTFFSLEEKDVTFGIFYLQGMRLFHPFTSWISPHSFSVCSAWWWF